MKDEDSRKLKSAISGILIVDKPSGMTSHDVVAIIRKGTGLRRIGHTGTLDPRASGVLVILIGPAVRLSEYLVCDRKGYEAMIRFGSVSDTYDGDGNVIQTGRETPEDEDEIIEAMDDFVGEITQVEPKILYDLIEKDFLPIVCPVGMDADYNSYNINADDAACEIAKAVNAEKLAFLTDIEGVYKDPKDPSTLISELTIDEAHALIDDGYIGGGMLPKLNNCIEAIEKGVSRVHILDGRIPHCLLLEIFTNKGIGTAILSKNESRYYHEDE